MLQALMQKNMLMSFMTNFNFKTTNMQVRCAACDWNAKLEILSWILKLDIRKAK